jgi:putative addiction module killer protein
MESSRKQLRIFEDARGARPFEEWLQSLKDVKGRAAIRARILRMMLGNMGDSKSIGEGVCEARIAFGPGYRIYYALEGRVVIVLLCGGDKGSQRRDIELAKRYLADYRRLIQDA